MASLQREEHGRARRRVVVVRDEEAAREALVAQGDVDVRLASDLDPAIAERLTRDLRRLGRADPTPADAAVDPSILDPDAAELLGLLASGMSLGEAAASLHLSRRTADRRLAAARRELRVETTAEALVAFAGAGASLEPAGA